MEFDLPLMSIRCGKRSLVFFIELDGIGKPKHPFPSNKILMNGP